MIQFGTWNTWRNPRPLHDRTKTLSTLLANFQQANKHPFNPFNSFNSSHNIQEIKDHKSQNQYLEKNQPTTCFFQEGKWWWWRWDLIIGQCYQYLTNWAIRYLQGFNWYLSHGYLPSLASMPKKETNPSYDQSK